MGTARILPTAIAAGVAVTDQLTKAVAVVLRCGPTRCLAHNSELMLGLGGGAAAWMVVALTVAGLGAWFAMTAAMRCRGPVPPVVDGLVVGGVLGNLIDRVALGYVRDFIPMPFNTVANVADLAVYAGLAAVVVLTVQRTVRASERR